MQFQRLYLLVFLMSIALLSLIGFQWYWINMVSRINQERFKQDVTDAMLQVVNQLEKKETVFWITQAAIKPGIEDQPAKKDSIVIRLPDGGIKKEIVISNRIEYSYESSDQGQIKSFQSNPSTKIQSFVFSSSNADKADTLIHSIQLTSNALNQNDSLKKVTQKSQVVKMALEEMLAPRVLDARINLGEVDSLLANALEARGIQLSFDFLVYSDQIKLIKLHHELTQENTLLFSPFQTTLFPNDIMGSKAFLSVHFPGGKKYINRKISYTVASSGVLILIIMGSFIYSVMMIVREKKISAMKNDFINNMTHEFKTPLATISLAVEVLKDPQLASNENLKSKYLSIIDEENQRLISHVERVLQLAQLDRHEINLDLQSADLEDIVKDAVNKMMLQAEKSGGEIKLETSSGCQVKVDSVHLLNVFVNLLDNAIKYSHNKPVVKVRLTREKEFARVDVIDNGPGISSEQQSLIFQRFYRINSGDIHNIKGFGLGLSYVKDIITLHQGQVSLISEPGKGSTFSILIPLASS